MALYSAKLTITTDNTPQALATADLTGSSIASRHTKAALVIVASEAGNDATATSRVGGVGTSRTNSIGLPILPSQSVTLPAGGGDMRNPYDVTQVYVSGKTGDVFNYTWLVG